LWNMPTANSGYPNRQAEFGARPLMSTRVVLGWF
jgi:hypothetical protein